MRPLRRWHPGSYLPLGALGDTSVTPSAPGAAGWPLGSCSSKQRGNNVTLSFRLRKIALVGHTSWALWVPFSSCIKMEKAFSPLLLTIKQRGSFLKCLPGKEVEREGKRWLIWGRFGKIPHTVRAPHLPRLSLLKFPLCPSGFKGHSPWKRPLHQSPETAAAFLSVISAAVISQAYRLIWNDESTASSDVLSKCVFHLLSCVFWLFWSVLCKL